MAAKLTHMNTADRLRTGDTIEHAGVATATVSVRCEDSGTQAPAKVGTLHACGNCGAMVDVVRVPLCPGDPADHNDLTVLADHTRMRVAA